MEYFEFLNGLRIICLPFEYFRKTASTTCLQKARRGRELSPLSFLIRCPRILNNNIYHSNKWEPPSFFHLDTNTWSRSGPFCWQNPSSGCNSGTDFVVVLECIIFNFVPTLNKSLRFTRVRRNYVNRTAVVLTNHCQSYTAFCLMCAVQSGHLPFFCSSLSPMMVHLRNLFLLSTRVPRKLLTPRWVSRRKDVK